MTEHEKEVVAKAVVLTGLSVAGYYMHQSLKKRAARIEQLQVAIGLRIQFINWMKSEGHKMSTDELLDHFSMNRKFIEIVTQP